MFETKHLANPHTRLEKECEQKLVSDMRAGINECLYLLDGQCFGKSPLSLGRNDSPLLWFRFHNTMQKWLVSPPVWHGQLIQGKLRNGTQAHVKLVQAVDSAENLINGGIGSPGWLAFNGNDFRFRSAQPGNECGKAGDIHLGPAQMFVTEIFPEELEMVSSGSDGIRTPIQGIEKRQVRANGLDRDKLIIKHDPTNLIRIGRAYSLYLHDLHSFHQKSDTDMYFHEEQQGS